MIKAVLLKESLSRQIINITASALAIGFISFISAIIFYVTQSKQKDLIDNYRTLGNVMSYQLVVPMSFQNKKFAEEVLLASRRHPNILYAEVYDIKEQLYFKYVRELGSVDSIGFFKKDILVKDNVLFMSFPVLHNNQQEGILILAFHFELYSKVLPFILWGGLFALVAFLMSIFLIYRTSQSISDPLRHLAFSFNNINLLLNKEEKISTNSGGEIALLYREFNQMLSLLKQSRNELEQVNTSLEKKVSERTYQLQLEKDKAEQASAAKSRFLAIMTHELRTPMNGVIATADLLRTTKLDNDQEQYLEVIVCAGKSLLMIIDDILDFSKIEAGKITFHQSPFDLYQLCKEVVALFNNNLIATGKSLELILDYDDSIPRCYLSDDQRIRQVIVNLVGNAIKFTQSGKVTLAVSYQEQLKVSVIDTGIGIKKEKIPQLFSAFTQADDDTNRMFGGTGLGLSICKRIIDGLGGEIYVESEPGNGSEFYFLLPCESLDEKGLIAAVKKSRSFDDACPQEDMSGHILVVEDNKVNQMIIKKQLATIKLDFSLAENGLEALAMAHTSKYDLILMDCQMPGMDGFEASTKIRQLDNINQKTPIVALTANVMDGIHERAIGSGMDAVLFKPIDIEKLSSTLEQYLD